MYKRQTLKAAILLNPAVAFLDSLNCPAETNYYCLIEEHLNHSVPVLIFAGENEINELDPVYEDMWALTQYEYVPESTDKLYFESANEGHGSSVWPAGDVADFSLSWLNYFLLEDESFCEFLTLPPQSTSQFLTTLECNNTVSYDINNDGVINNEDLIYLVVGLVNENTIENTSDINFDSYVNIFDLLMLADYLQDM